jgi:hypothetical protein
LPAIARDDASAFSTDVGEAGVAFNDAKRLPDGGLWKTPADSHNQVPLI